MKLFCSLTNLLNISVITAAAISTSSHPNVEDAARYARTLVKRESLTNVNTIFNETGIPTSFVEYYADCGDGTPVMLIIDMSSTNKNIQKGSPVSLSIRVGDHPPNEKVDPKYPGSRPNSVAGSPRINLRGHFKTFTKDLKEDNKGEESEVGEYFRLEKCFLERHKDAAWWLPHNPIHSSHFVKFEIEGIYFIGGFGDTGYIGEIPVEMYKNAKAIDGEENEEGKEVGHPFGAFGEFSERLDHDMNVLEKKILKFGAKNNQNQPISNEVEDHLSIMELINEKSDFSKKKASEIWSDLNELKRQTILQAYDILKDAAEDMSLF